MSKKQWMVLLMLFLTYLLLGASIFYHIESRLEIERIEKAKRERIEINALLYEHYVPSRNHGYDEILGKLTRYCGKSVYNYSEGEVDPIKWDFYNSFYFAYTVVSTIGYGNLAPTNMLCRVLMIFYGLIGIPMNGILLTQLGEFFGRVFVKAHEKYKSYKHGRSNDYYSRKLTTFERRKFGLAAQIFVHLMPGFVMFIFFPAFLFSHYEGWTYDEAVYYAFVTLTTIGFGDYVAGQDNSKGSGIFFILYKAFLICWISFGLGYTVMIMTFIARGMRSKKITRIEHKLAINLKHTQSKIWNELNKELNSLRRVFNELQLSKVKRVYVDECNYEVPFSTEFPRSNSFPDLRDLLYGGKENDDDIGHRPRRRANSEVVPTENQLTRVVSETDLQRIDKTATFATHAMVQPAELLARLVNILGYIPPATEDMAGPDDFSNQTTFVGQNNTRRSSKIVDNNEKEPDKEKELPYTQNSSAHGIWTIGQEKIPRFFKPRSRAASEVRLHETRYQDRNVERTWSGPTAARKMQQLLKAQMSMESNNKDRGVKEPRFSKFRSFALAKSVPKALISSGPCKNWFSTSLEKRNSESERECNNKDVVEHSSVSGLPRNNGDNRRRDSASTISDSRRYYRTHTGAGNPIATESRNLLEETSVADFLRALTLLHASVATSGSWAAVNDDDRIRRNQPQRKMGIASLTPPKLPSLFTLFTPSQSSNAHSNQMTFAQESSINGNNMNDSTMTNLSQMCPTSRRNSLTFVKPGLVTKSRRFSLRPVATPISPPTPPRNRSPFSSDSRRSSYENRSFSLESPKQPLIGTEQVPGLSTPIQSSCGNRRFSLRPTQSNWSQTGISTGNVVVGATTNKGLPRWKAGMLQRQIGQMNLRRRARAFSLSDVQPGDNKGRTEPFILSSSIYKKNNRDAARKNVSLHEASNEGEPVSGSVEESKRFISSNRTSSDEPNFSFLQETSGTNNIRFEDNNLPTTTFDAESVLLERIGNNAEERLSSGNNIMPLESHQYTSLFNVADTESTQQSLVEIKIENPIVANTIQRSIPEITPNDIPLDNSHVLTELTNKKQQSHSSSNRS